MYFLKDLIGVAPYSKNTFYRRWDEFRAKNKIKYKLEGNYLTEAEAKNIAKELGFEKEFDKYLIEKTK